MSKIRINELARELEVKPSRILDLLPELGVSDKKTHSSSLEDDVALAIRRHFGGEIPVDEEDEGPGLLDYLAREERVPAAEEPKEAAAPVSTGTAQVVDEPAAPPETVEPPAAPAPQPPAPPQEELKPPVKQIIQPLRPPLAGRPVVPPIPAPARPPAPVTPPLASAKQAPSAAAAPTTQPAPRPPAPPAPAAASPVQPAPKAPEAPRHPTAPAPRPGQIISGPRQPLPPSIPSTQNVPAAAFTPGEPRAASPGAPLPPPQPRPAPRPPAAQTTGPVVSKANLAGQPAPRPVVPPRPDLVARLTQTQPRAAMPGQPAAPRPGTPRSSPVPGQPIYRGPVRPGQPVVRGPGMPGPAGGGAGAPRPLRRGMHPTAPLQPEVAPAPGDTRRHQTKPGARTARERAKDQEGKLLPIMARHREEPVVAVNREITIGEGVTVKELSEKLGIKASLVIKKLVDRKIFATINQTLDVKLAEELAKSFGASSSHLSFEEQESWEVELAEEEKDVVKRAPVVTVMGHVDHGKTSLLDALRQANVAEREAGGITQHIGAYQIQLPDSRKIVFIDTPGHEAFTRMRSRGAKVTDIVILVVAADDGVMPQTLEAISHAKASGVPILVAINKIDKPDAQPDRVKQQLSDRGLLAEDWGGETVMVPVSAKAKQNLELLLEMILLVADIQNLKANPSRPAICTVLEAKLDRGRGPVATLLVRNGTLRVGDFFICGTVFGKVRALIDDRGESVKEAEPSTPVEVLGLEELPEVGDSLQVVTDTAKAKQIVMYREAKAREQSLAKTNRLTLEGLHKQLKEGETKELNLIIKADVGGSAEVLSEMLQKLSNDKVKIRVLHSGVGAITEYDVLLASTADAIVIGFNVRPERNAAAVAEQEKVDIRLHTIIYELTQEIKNAMVGMLEPVYKEVYKGRADVRETFRISKVGTVAGCLVQEGVLQRNCQVRLLRDNIVIHTGKIESLRRFKDEVSEVKSGLECGVSLVNFNDVKPNDVLEAFVTERVATEALV